LCLRIYMAVTNFATQSSAAQLTDSQQDLRLRPFETVTSGIDLPTLAVALAVYGGYVALTYFFQDMPRWVAAPLGAIWLTWHGSLQHETIHDHPTPWRRVNRTLAGPPLSLWIPYLVYRASHLQHHRHGGRRLTDVTHDPESFYLRPGALSRYGSLTSALRLANCTLAGRLILGPALVVFRFWASEASTAIAGDRRRRVIWARHGMAVAIVLLWTSWVCHIPVVVYVLWMVYPSVSLSLLRSFAEHRAHQEPSLRTVTVEANPLWAMLFLNNNLHIAHHAQPRLPWYRLPMAWRQMRGRAVGAGLVFPGGYRQVIDAYLWRAVISVEHPDMQPDSDEAKLAGIEASLAR
jgi:fatty acid desaturase